jgi:hypothetical protein
VARGRGIFSRLRDTVRNVVEQIQDRFASEPPEEEPDVSRTLEQRMRAVWRSELTRKERGKRAFYKNRDFFIDFETGYGIEDEEEIFRDWEAYVKYMVKGEGRYLRNNPRNPFWNIVGVDPMEGDFDWDDWRTAMGYKSRKG